MNRHANYGVVDLRNLRPASRMHTRLSDRDVAYHAGVSSQLQIRTLEREAQQVRALLMKPLPHIEDPATRVQVLEAIRAGSPVREVQAGEIVELPKTLAVALAAIGRVQMV